DHLDQVTEADHPALAGLERLAVGAVHGAEGDVLHLHVPGHTGPPGGTEHLGEVVGLAGVDDVEGQVGAELFRPVPDRGDVGGGVQVSAGAVDQDQGRDLLFVAGGRT